MITFDPHPRIALGNHVELISTLERRLELLAEAGAEATLVAPFTPELMALEPEVFAERYLRAIGAEAVAAGADFRFGSRRRGDLALLERLGFEILEVETVPGVSSSRDSRTRCTTGDVVGAAAMLGRPYELDGVVVAGDQRGGTLGYPTANLALEPHARLPEVRHLRRGRSRPPRGASRSARTRTTAVPSAASSRTCSTSRAISTAGASSSRSGSGFATRRSSPREAELVAQIGRDVEATRAAVRPV